MSKRFLYGAIDITMLKALAIGTNESKIKEFISGKADKNIKSFRVVVESEKNYNVSLNIEGFSPKLDELDEINSKMRKLWELIYFFELDLSESNEGIYIFKAD